MDTAAIDRLVGLLEREGVLRGLISRGDADRIRERHVEDSLRAAAAFRPDDRLAYDLGSGAGLPGLPLAIALPQVAFVLAEVRASRAAFLKLAIEELALPNVTVHRGRAEELTPGADVATARAFAPLERSWPLASELLRPGGRLVYFAGASIEDPAGDASRIGEGAATVSLIVESGNPLVIMERQ